ncbi:MAG: hypothetical protein D6730_09620 [Bacteroidetes bacterium]|nr:MAG: hypothetical protein D6730_09620 [Bacteroidota bacterium]
MKHRKVGQLINSLSPKELSHFGRWLEAELDGRQQYLRKLFACLAAQPRQLPTEAQLWAQLYPGKTYQDGRLRKLSAVLCSLLEEYLAIAAFRKDRGVRNKYLLAEINRRVPALFPKMERKMRQQIEKSGLRNAAYFRSMYELEMEVQRHHAIHKPHRSKRKQYKETVRVAHQLNRLFDHWWMIERLSLSTYFNNLAHKYGHAIADDFAGLLITYLERSPREQLQPVLYLYAETYRQLTGWSTQPLGQLIQAFQTHKSRLEPEQLYSLGTLLLNFFVRQFNQSAHEHTSQKLYSLYLWGLEDGWLYAGGLLHISHYQNLIHACMKLQHFEQAWHFLHSLKDKLPASQREMAFQYCLGLYYFETASFRQLIGLFGKLTFPSPIFEIQARILLLQAQYETGEYETEWLLIRTHTLMRYIQKQSSISPQQKRSNLNKLKCFAGLLTAFGPEKLRKLHRKVEKQLPLNHQQWLMSKLDEKLAKASGG